MVWDSDRAGSPLRARFYIVMAGLVPAIPLRHARTVRQYYLYILASRPGGSIYVGVTNDLVRRVREHKDGSVKGFTTRYGIDRLVYFEVHDTAYAAIQRKRTSSTGRASGRPG